MEAEISLRPIEARDADLLFQIYASTRELELQQVPWPPEQKLAFLRLQFQTQHGQYMQSYPSAQFQIIEEDGRPVGRFYVDRRAEEIRIIDLALLPAARGRGIGTHLLRGVMEDAQRMERPVRLHVEQFNPAYRLYTRLGFRPIEERGIYLLLEWDGPASD